MLHCYTTRLANVGMCAAQKTKLWPDLGQFLRILQKSFWSDAELKEDLPSAPAHLLIESGFGSLCRLIVLMSANVD